VNGKLYQTVELEAGRYQFQARQNAIFGTPTNFNVTAALGNDLPDVDDIATQSLNNQRIASILPEGTVTIIEFSVPAKGNVSMGFVATLGLDEWVQFDKVELYNTAVC